MKKVLLLLVLAITVSCSSISTPTLISLDVESPTPFLPTNTTTPNAPPPTFTPTKISSPQSSSFVQLKYPNHENCRIQVDTRKWEITEEGKKFIESVSRFVPISNKPGVGGTVFIKHKNHIGCQLKWRTDGTAPDFQTPLPLEVINGKVWEVWSIEMAQGKIYYWPELSEIQFSQQWPLPPEQASCQEDIYEILGSLQCE